MSGQIRFRRQNAIDKDLDFIVMLGEYPWIDQRFRGKREGGSQPDVRCFPFSSRLGVILGTRSNKVFPASEARLMALDGKRISNHPERKVRGMDRKFGE